MNKVAFYMDAIEKIASEEKKKKILQKWQRCRVLQIYSEYQETFFDTTVEGIDVTKTETLEKLVTLL